jgi:alkyl hydroperoxide reductase subunit F
MVYELAIIGGGPAGVAAGVYASRKQLRSIFITPDFNSQSSVSDDIQNWIGTVSITGTDLTENLRKHLLAYAGDVISIKEGEYVTLITKSKEGFLIKTDKAEYEAKAVMISSGSRRKKLDIPGAEKFDNKGLTYCASCDGPLFADKDVVVVGGGNAAFETAAQLLAYVKSVTLLNHTNEYKADPVTIKNLEKNPKLKLIKNAVPTRVEGDKFVEGFVYTDSITKKETHLSAEGVFVEIGAVPNTSFVKDLVSLTEYNQIIVNPKTQMTSVPGIWAAGDCTDGLYHQNNIAAGDGVKALEDIYLYLRA